LSGAEQVIQHEYEKIKIKSRVSKCLKIRNKIVFFSKSLDTHFGGVGVLRSGECQE
jgi:hypothetical protein